MKKRQQDIKFNHKPERRKFLRNSLLLGSGGLLLNSITPSFANIYSTKRLERKKLKPVLVGDW